MVALEQDWPGIDTARVDPVFEGTTISVHLIAALVRGGSVEEAIYAYPNLTAAQVRAAVAYDQSHPWTGKPYPPKSFKRMLSELGLDDMDDIDWRGARPRSP